MPLDSSRRAIFKTANLKITSTFRAELFNEATICLIFSVLDAGDAQLSGRIELIYQVNLNCVGCVNVVMHPIRVVRYSA